MNKLLIAAGSFVFFSTSVVAQVSPTTPKAVRIRIIQGPEIESAQDFLTVIRWTTNNPGGSPVHYGIVHYGTNPKNLNRTAKSPIRLNPAHSTTIFRVRIEGLKAGTTYYYTVASEEANGIRDGVTSAVKQFSIHP
jgi:Purple acid Phosphatase, N-terminal domain